MSFETTKARKPEWLNGKAVSEQLATEKRLFSTMKSKTKAKRCEIVLPNGSVGCSYLSLVRSLLQADIVHHAKDATQVSVWEFKSTVRHRECRRQESWWIVGLSTSEVQLWLKSMEVLHTGVTSITSQTVVRPIDRVSVGARNAGTAGLNGIGPMSKAAVLTGFGKTTLDTSHMEE